MINFDKSRAKHPELWEECSRAFNPAGINSTEFAASPSSRGVYPDYALGKHGYINAGTGYTYNLYVKPTVFKGVYCTAHYANAADNIRFPDSGLPNNTDSATTNVTMSAWIWANEVDSYANLGFPVAYGNTSSGGAAAYNKNMHIYLNATGVGIGTYATDIACTPFATLSGKWFHFAYTKQHLTARGYFQGKYAGGGTLPAASLTLYGTGSIGSLIDSGTYKYPFLGYLGPITIHNRILSDQEIQLLASDPQIMYAERRFRRTASAPTGNRRRRIILPQWYV